MGIVILVLLAIGAFVVAKFLIQWLFKLTRKSSDQTTDYTAALTGQKAVAAQDKVRTVRVGRHNRATFAQEDTPWDDLPKYNGETGMFGLPKYKDVVVPDKHNYATVCYMDGWFRQYVYDVLAARKHASWYAKTEGRIKIWGTLLFFPLLFILAAKTSVQIYLIVGIVISIALYAIFLGAPSGIRVTRRRAERFRNLTPDDWRQVYQEVQESQDRVDEMTRAFRRSGIVRRHW